MADYIDIDREPGDKPKATRSRDDGLPPEVSDDEVIEDAEKPRRRRAATIVQMKLAGATFAEIAQVMEMKVVAVRTIFETAIAASADKDIPYDTMRAIYNARLEGLLKSVFPKALRSGDPDQLAYQRQALSVIDRGIKMNGLDAPTRVEVYSPSAQEFTRVIEMAAEALGGTTGEADIFADVYELEAAPDGEEWREEDGDVQ
jgi:hypothetical protein